MSTQKIDSKDESSKNYLEGLGNSIIGEGIGALETLGSDKINEKILSSNLEEAINRYVSTLSQRSSELSDLKKHQVEQVKRAFADPEYQKRLANSFDDLRKRIIAGTDLSKHQGTINNIEGFKKVLSILEAPAKIGGVLFTGVEINSAVETGKSADIGRTLVGAFAGVFLGAATGLAVSALVATTGAVLIPTIAVGAVASVIATVIPNLLPEAWAESIGDWYKEEVLEGPIGSFGRSIGRNLARWVHDIDDDFNDAKGWTPPRRDPLALDLDGDGIETIGADGRVVFDHDGDGVKSGTGWVSGDDGFLVRDLDGNGTIDNGAELFGVDTVKADGSKAVDGFDALADLDSNGDGIFNADDAEFANVKVWRDLDQDGISDAGELSSLIELGISAINLNAQAGNQDIGNGNVQTAAATYVRENGEEATVANLDLATNTFYREFTDEVELSEQAEGLPTIQGFGQVRDFREAVSLSPTLASLVSEYTEQTSRTEQYAQLDAVLAAWSNTSNAQTSIEQAQAQNIELVYLIPGQSAEAFNQGDIQQAEIARTIGILEAFNGNGFVSINADSVTTGSGMTMNVQEVVIDGETTRRVFISLSQPQIDLLNQSYGRLKTYVHGNFVTQDNLEDYLNSVQLQLSDGGSVTLDFSAMNQLIETRIAENPNNTFADVVGLINFSGDYLLGNGWEGIRLLTQALENGVDKTQLDNLLASNVNDAILLDLEGDSHIAASLNNKFVLGMDGNDTITGSSGDDALYGGAGTDTLRGGAGDDTLNGGTGEGDYLEGGQGNDTYVFNRGDGNITINNYDDTGEASIDTLRFGAGIAVTDLVKGLQSGNDLLLTVQGEEGSTEVITVKDFFYRYRYHSVDHAANLRQLDRFEFADGTQWNRDGIHALTLIGDETDNTLSGDARDELIEGRDGDDTLSGNGGNDTLNGGAGTDTLRGGAGDDTLNAGAGEGDYLEGGQGNDTYVFNRGDGNITINNYDDTGAASIDTLRFGVGIEVSDLVKGLQSGNDLLLTVKGNEDSTEVITVKDFFYRYRYHSVEHAANLRQLDRFEFADGTQWDRDGIHALTLIGDETDNTLSGDARDELIEGRDGDDTLSGNGGSDTLNGGAGTDTLRGGAGDDTLNAGVGEGDYLEGGQGNDTYVFNRGDGNITINNYDDTGAASIDTLRFGAGIAVTDLVKGLQSGDDLLLTVKGEEGSTEVITVKDFFYRYRYHSVEHAANLRQLDRFEFADGTQWDRDGIHALTMLGDETDNALAGDGRDELIEGRGGDDTLSGNGGNDTLNGGAGTDTLRGGAGDDTLNAGAGEGDYLEGGQGNDTYVFNRGDGNITINNYDDTGAASIDTLRFGAGIAVTDLVKGLQSGNDLLLTVKGGDETEEVITVKDFFYRYSYHSVEHAANLRQLDRFEFADGNQWDRDGIHALTMLGDETDNALSGDNRDELIEGRGGNDTLSGNGGNDTLNGGAGTDTLRGGAGDDTLNAGVGEGDYLEGGQGNDTYVFNRGDGNITINNYDDTGAASIDTLRFGAGITVSDLTSGARSGDHLLLTISSDDDTEEVITVQDFFYRYRYHSVEHAANLRQLDRIEFADGTTWDLSVGNEGNNTLSGTDHSTLLLGLGGDDTYVFNSGDGAAIILNADAGHETSVDVAQFNDVSFEDLWLSRSDNHLQITVAGTDTQVTVDNWYDSPANQLDHIETASSVLLNSQVEQLVSAMAAYDVPHGAGNVVPQEVRDELQTALSEAWQPA